MGRGGNVVAFAHPSTRACLGREPHLSLEEVHRRDASTGILEGSFVGQFIPRLAEKGFVGTATECLRKLEMIAGTEATRRRGWPATPRGLAGILRRLAPALAEVGIVVEFARTGHDRQRIIRIHLVDQLEASDSVLVLT